MQTFKMAACNGNQILNDGAYNKKQEQKIFDGFYWINKIDDWK